MNTIQRIVFMPLALSLTCLAYGQNAAQAKPATATVDYINMPYQGSFRAAPKTHYAKSPKGQLFPTEVFSDVDSLRKTLPTDSEMRKKYSRNMGSPTRFREELRNVSVIAYIHAVKLENGIDAHGTQGDLNFRVMLGTLPTPRQGRFFTAEVSGLPIGAADIDTFKAARRQLLQLLLYVAEIKPEAFHAEFVPLNRPIKVRVAGSLFFDGHRASNTVGPDYARADSVWEIHPVISIDQK